MCTRCCKGVRVNIRSPSRIHTAGERLPYLRPWHTRRFYRISRSCFFRSGNVVSPGMESRPERRTSCTISRGLVVFDSSRVGASFQLRSTVLDDGVPLCSRITLRILIPHPMLDVVRSYFEICQFHVHSKWEDCRICMCALQRRRLTRCDMIFKFSIEYQYLMIIFKHMYGENIDLC